MTAPNPLPAFMLPSLGPAPSSVPPYYQPSPIAAPQASTSRAPVASTSKAPAKPRGSKGKANGHAASHSADPPSANVVRAGTARDDETLYINPKQYSRILKRRAARARLEETKRLSNERKVRQLRLPRIALCSGD